MGVTTPSAVPIIDPSPSKMTMKKKMTDRIYDPGKSETASATAMKISPVPDGASLVSVLVGFSLASDGAKLAPLCVLFKNINKKFSGIWQGY